VDAEIDFNRELDCRGKEWVAEGSLTGGHCECCSKLYSAGVRDVLRDGKIMQGWAERVVVRAAVEGIGVLRRGSG
jgi:hypothetical protein